MWKYNVELISSSQYVVIKPFYGVCCDEQNRLWVQVYLNFGENTDAYHERERSATLVSDDMGVTWQLTDQAWPVDPSNRVTLPDGTIVELGEAAWERYPRAEIERLRQEGYHVWDLGKEADYCAIIYACWLRRSTDGGRTWQEQPFHEQLPFMAHLAVVGYPMLLGDGTLLHWAYGFTKEQRYDVTEPIGGRCNAYVLRSLDHGHRWQLVEMADGGKSPAVQGFTEIFPLALGGGRLFAMLRTSLGANAFSTYSTDGGVTWSPPRQSPVRGKHPFVARLGDGTVICTYQRRFAPPFGVRARVTSDFGQTWSEEIIIRDDITIDDGLGNPYTVELGDGTLFTCFNARKLLDGGGSQSFIGGTRWSRDRQPIPHAQERQQQIWARGSWAPTFAVPPRRPRYNSQTGTSPWQPASKQP